MLGDYNPFGPCPHVCNMKASSGYCSLTACQNPAVKPRNYTYVFGAVNDPNKLIPMFTQKEIQAVMSKITPYMGK